MEVSLFTEVLNRLQAENQNLKSLLEASKSANLDLYNNIKDLRESIAKRDAQIQELLDLNDSLEATNDELRMEIAFNGDDECDGECPCVENDIEANEEFLKDLVLTLINNGYDADNIPDVMDEIVSAIKKNMGR